MLVELERDAFRGIYQKHRWSYPQFNYYLHAPNALVAVAEIDDVIVGYVAGFIYNDSGRKTARIHSIAVTSKTRRQGIGSMLLKWIIDRARAGSAGVIFLEVAQQRLVARRLFKLHGFEVERQLPNYYDLGKHGLLMRKSLDIQP